MNTCSMCPSKVKLKRKKVTRYHYTESGLDNVYLTGVFQYACSACGEIYTEIPKPLQLMDAIANGILAQTRILEPKEVRFLRKHLGLSSAEFARQLKYTPEHLSRMENGKMAISEQFNLAVRMFYALSRPDRNYTFHDWLESKEKRSKRAIDMVEAGGAWRAKVA